MTRFFDGYFRVGRESVTIFNYLGEGILLATRPD